MGLPGNLTCSLDQTCFAVLDSHMAPPFRGLSSTFIQGNPRPLLISILSLVYAGSCVAGLTLDFDLAGVGLIFLHFGDGCLVQKLMALLCSAVIHLPCTLRTMPTAKIRQPIQSLPKAH